jgi:hypothetical protein
MAARAVLNVLGMDAKLPQKSTAMPTSYYCCSRLWTARVVFNFAWRHNCIEFSFLSPFQPHCF